MAEVTYADLKFGTSLNHQHKVEDEDMYENIKNFDGLQRSSVKEELGPTQASERHGRLMTWLHRWSLLLSLVSFFLIVTLLVGVIFLAVKYVQQSHDFQDFRTQYNELTSSLSRRLERREDELDSIWTELSDTRAELEWTLQDYKSLNGSFMECQQEVRTCEVSRQASERTLELWVRDLCPQGWHLFGRKCLWISEDMGTWEQSRANCEFQDSNLLVVPWDDKALQDFISEKKDDFWVGKEIFWDKWPPQWRWPSSYPNRYTQSHHSWKISQGALQTASDSMKMRWICEKNIVLTSIILKHHYRIPGFTLQNNDYRCYAN